MSQMKAKKYTIVTNIKPQQMFIKSNYDYCFFLFFYAFGKLPLFTNISMNSILFFSMLISCFQLFPAALITLFLYKNKSLDFGKKIKTS